jgi:type IV pilus assembly protein PilM
VAAHRTIGLDIGTSAVRAAQVAYTKKDVVLEKFGQVPLPEGAVRDGEVVDPAPVVAALRKLWRAERFATKRVVLGVANHRVVVREVELPWIPPRDLQAALPFQVQDMLPMPVENAVLDFHPVEQFAGPAGQAMLRGLLIAASREMVLGNVRAVEAAGLTASSVDLTSFAVLRSLGRPLDADVRAEALVDVGAQVTNVVVHSAGVPRFVRILLRGGQEITDAVAEHLGVAQADAEVLKRATGPDAADEDGLVHGDVARVVADSAQELIDELRGSLDYYSSTHPHEPVDRVVVSGGGALLHGFAGRLSEVTRLPVVTGDPLRRVRTDRLGIDPAVLDRLSPSTAVPVGLALGGAR